MLEALAITHIIVNRVKFISSRLGRRARMGRREGLAGLVSLHQNTVYGAPHRSLQTLAAENLAESRATSGSLFLLGR